jgi:hypothetical protein
MLIVRSSLLHFKGKDAKREEEMTKMNETIKSFGIKSYMNKTKNSIKICDKPKLMNETMTEFIKRDQIET